MRLTCTQAEEKVRMNFKEFCEKLLGETISIDESITDSPDIVFTREDGTRVGVEITRLGYEKFMKWLSKGTTPTKRREANVVVNLDKQLAFALNKKNKKHLSYRVNRKLKEVWLCFHNDLYEFNIGNNISQMDRESFIGDAWYHLKRHRCKFKRALFFSENSKEFVEIYNKLDISFRPKPYGRLPVIKFLEMTAVVINHINFDVKDPSALEDEQTFN